MGAESTGTGIKAIEMSQENIVSEEELDEGFQFIDDDEGDEHWCKICDKPEMSCSCDKATMSGDSIYNAVAFVRGYSMGKADIDNEILEENGECYELIDKLAFAISEVITNSKLESRELEICAEALTKYYELLSFYYNIEPKYAEPGTSKK